MRISYRIILLASIILSTACSKDNSGNLSPEAAITSFSLGQFNVLHNDITYENKDTMVITQITNGRFKYDIDHINGLIFNTDTLPYGSVLNSVKTNVVATGTAYFHIPDSNDVYHNVLWTNSLEIDLNKPVKVIVISTDESYRREYTLQTNIYDANPDSMKWEGIASLPDDIAFANAVECNGTMAVLGFDGNGKPCVTKYSNEDNSWSNPVICNGLSQNVVFSSLSIHGGTFAVADGGNILTSEDCENWDNVKSGTLTEMLLPFRQTGDYGEAWAVTDNGWLASSSDLANWSEIQELPDRFPIHNISGLCYRLATNRNILRYIIIGTDGENIETLIWTKLSTENRWSRITVAEDHSLKCPAFDNLSMIMYDGRLYSFGGPMENFFESRDNGITWRECHSLLETYNTWNNYMQIPEAYKGIDIPFCSAVDSTNAIWLISSDSRGVWRGYLNRLHK